MSTEDRRPAGERGFSVLELVVACAVLATVLVLAGGALREANRQLGDAQRSLTRGSTQLALTTIRHDAKSARSVRAGASTAAATSIPAAQTPASWTSTPLVLAGPDGSRAVYRFAGGALERVVQDPSGRERTRQIVARQVALFRWRRPAVGLVEVEIALRPPPRPPRILDRSAPRPPAPPALERITVALRSRSRSAW